MTNIYNQQVLQSLDSEINFTYESIANFVQRFLNRSDTDTIEAIPQFISLAESRLALDLKFLAGVNVTQFTIPASATPTIAPYSVVIQKPNGWRVTKSMGFVTPQNNRNYIYPRSLEYLQTFMQDFVLTDLSPTFNYTGFLYYSDYDQSNWLIGPLDSSVAYTLEVQYFSEITQLSSTNPTNYWTQYAPRALIYGALVEASSFLRSDQRVAMWESTYNQTISQLAKENTNRFDDNIIVRSN